MNGNGRPDLDRLNVGTYAPFKPSAEPVEPTVPEEEEDYGYKDDDESVGGEERRSETPVPITQEVLGRVQRELCLIKLCWPKVDVGEDLFLSALPETYRSVSDKEKLLLWHAENFRRQFHATHRERKPLLLACENECGVQKFVSTTIRRSTLPYPELYTWQGCAGFVSDYIDYEPPDEAFIMPRHLRSPTWTLNFEKGNNFECATLLVSLLLGQGYNAFVASGYASREQVLYDMTRRICPYLPKAEKPPPVATAQTEVSKYELILPSEFKSEFLEELELKEKKKIEMEQQRQEDERQRIIFELEQPPPDMHWGRRIHAWVVVLPEKQGVREQEILEPFFIEPSSGVSYKLTDYETNVLYLGVESIWNDQNYWVNMQYPKGCVNINWDLNKVELWEHLLPGEPWTTRDLAAAELDEDIVIEQEKHLDMPHSYVNEITINNSDFQRRYPNGRKTRYYKKAKVELYASYVQTDGLVEQVTVYDDYDYKTPIQIYEKYKNRVDKLVESRKDLNVGYVIDYYKRGRPDQCKEHRYFISENETVDSERILDYYSKPRFDGLSRFEMHPFYLTQHYVDRGDLLYYRHIQFSTDKSNFPQDGIHHRQIWKIVEKFHRNEAITPASKDIAIREFAIKDNEIRLKYHYNQYQISRATRTFIRPPLADRGDRLVFDPATTSGYNPDPFAPPDRKLDLYRELDKQLKEEDRLLICVRDAENEMATFLKVRANEFFTPKLTISLFDRNRNDEATAEMFAKGELRRIQSEKAVMDDVDHLGPYLARIGNPSHVSKAQAYLLREDCLNDFKQILVDRANYILRKFEECSKEMEKLQMLLTQKEDMTREEEEELLTKTNEMSFKLHTLEVRLNRHRNIAPIWYRTLVSLLQQNPYLAALYQK